MVHVRVASKRGITLVELLVVLAIVSVTLSIVIPSLGTAYESWTLRSTGRRAAAFFRLASDTARREGTDIAAYYADHRLTLLRNGVVYRELEVPPIVQISPQKPGGAIFMRTGQIVATGQFVLENSRGRKSLIDFGPLPGQVVLKESSE